MNRRNFLLLSALGIGGTAGYLFRPPHIPGEGLPEALKPVTGPDGKRRLPWQNWSGFQQCLPEQVLAPHDEAELAAILKGANNTVRPVGAGHSFTGLVPTDHTIVSLRRFAGLTSHDTASMTATFGAGTRLANVGKPLFDIGQSMPNMPDVDEQTLAGAMATATHGTAESVGALHAFIKQLKLVTPQGEVLTCSEQQNSDVFKAAQVSLGSLGIITEYTLQNVPTRRLKSKVEMLPLEDILSNYDKLVAENFSVDFYFFPFMDYGAIVTINETTDPVKKKVADADADAVMEMKEARDLLSRIPALRRKMMNDAAKEFVTEEHVGEAYDIFPSDRTVRFNEMEYHMDRKHLVDTVRKVKATIEDKHPEVFFPCEVRSVKGDDAWLSPFYGHNSGSIAVHRYYKEDPRPLFKTLEPIYTAIQGRPHWGKMHHLAAADFATLYPKWAEFQKVREALDPQGKMLNDHLKQVFGITS